MSFQHNILEFRLTTPRTGLSRPRTLVAAARAGQSGWRRGRDLRRLLRADDLPRPAQALERLKDEEARQNEARLQDQADYDMRRHVLLLIAILAETRLLRARQASPVTSPGTASRARP